MTVCLFLDSLAWCPQPQLPPAHLAATKLLVDALCAAAGTLSTGRGAGWRFQPLLRLLSCVAQHAPARHLLDDHIHQIMKLEPMVRFSNKLIIFTSW
jgi:hypothetical protein